MTELIVRLLRALFPAPAGRHADRPITPAAHRAESGHGRSASNLGHGRTIARVRPFVPVPDVEPMPANVGDAPDPVRPYVRRLEAAREAQRADATRLGIAVLADIATRAEVSA